jgi:hypothetical protein
MKEGVLCTLSANFACGKNNFYRKASLWEENCPNFFFFFVWAGKTEVFFWVIYPTLGPLAQSAVERLEK